MGDKMKKIKFSASLILLFFFSEIFANQVNQYTNIYNRSIKGNCLKIFKKHPNVCSCVKERWIAHLKVNERDKYDFHMLDKHYEKLVEARQSQSSSVVGDWIGIDGGIGVVPPSCSDPKISTQGYRRCLNYSLRAKGFMLIKEAFTVDGKTYGVDKPAPIKAYLKYTLGEKFEEKWLVYQELLKVTEFDNLIRLDCLALEENKKKAKSDLEQNDSNRNQNNLHRSEK